MVGCVSPAFVVACGERDRRKWQRAIVLGLVLIIVLAANTSVSSAESTIAKWKADANAALSFTFDDTSSRRIIQSTILEEYGLRGTFYTNSGWPMPVGYYAMADRGHEIGAHSTSHVDWRVTPVTPENLDAEILQNKLEIEARTGQPCVSYAAPFGYLDSNVTAYVSQHFLTQRSTLIGINAAEGHPRDPMVWDPMFLTIAPYTPYDIDATAWTDQEYVTNMRNHVEDVVSVRGWAVEMYHNFGTENKRLQVTESAFRAHLADMAGNYSDNIWFSTVGRASRYLMERENTILETLLQDESEIELRLNFTGDTLLFNESLTVLADIPDAWAQANLIVTQDGERLPLSIVEKSNETFAMFDALPGRGNVRIAIEIMGDASLDGYVDDNDLSLLLASWGEVTGWGNGEFDGTPVVNDNDLSLLLANWHEGVPPPMGNSSIPEPATMMLLCCAAAPILLKRRRFDTTRRGR